jgi:uncharacterized protein involved in exopolysaccharide biosynthesis
MDQTQFEAEINLREYVDIVSKRWKIIVVTALFVAIATFVYSLSQKPAYEAKAVIMVRGGGANALSQLNGLAGMMGMNIGSGSSSNIADMMELIKSKAVATKVLDDLKLSTRIKGWDRPEMKRRDMITAVSGMLKTPKVNGNLIDIKVEINDPQLAADVANAYIDALSYYMNTLNNTEAQRKLKYIEAELPRVEADLKRTESMLQLVPRSASGFSLSGQSGPQRDFDIYNSVYTMLRKERESAKLEAAKDIPQFAVIDPAEKPLSKSKPRTRLNIALGLVLGLFFGVSIAFIQEYWNKSEIKH